MTSSIQRLADLFMLDASEHKVRLPMALTYNAYMDESGTDQESPVAGMAGYLATYEQWQRFDAEWKNILRHRGVGSFHMSEFEHWRGEFKACRYWTKEIHDRLCERLCETARDLTMFGVGAVVVKEQYERIIPNDLKREFVDPYYVLLYFCLALLSHHQDSAHFPKPVNFLFDQEVSKRTNATYLFNQAKERHDKNGMLDAIAFGYRVKYRPLQAADLLVYEATKFRKNQLLKPSRLMRPPLQILSQRKNLLIAFLTEQQLTEFVQTVRIANRPAKDET